MVRVTLGVKDRFPSEFVLETVGVWSYVKGLDKARDERVCVIFGVPDNSMEPT